MDIQMKIIHEKEKNSKSNHIDNNSCTFTLWKEYDNVRIKLQDHNHALEELTQKVLKLDLLNPSKINPKKNSNNLKIDKLKSFHKKSYQENHKDELFIIKKLLLINLKSFQVMQRLYQENCDLQKSLDKTYQLANKQKQQIQKIKQENEILEKAAKFFKTGLCLFFNKFDNVTNRIIIQTYSRSGFQNFFIQNNSNTILQQTCKPYEFSTNETKIIGNSTSESNYTNNVPQLTMFYNIPLQSSYLSHPCIDLSLKEFHSENISSTKEAIEIKIYNTHETSPKEEIINFSPLQVANVQTSKDYNDFCMFEDTRSLLVLKDFNFLTRNVSEFLKITSPLIFYENVQTNFELGPFFDENDNKKRDFYIPHNFTINETIEHISNEKTNFYSENSTQKTSDGKYNNLKISQSFVIDTNISIGVGDGSALFCDQQSQVEDHLLTKITLADKKPNGRESYIAKITFEHKTNKESIVSDKSNIEAMKNASGRTNSRHDFKRSLQALREVIESCRRTSEQCRTNQKTAEKGYRTGIKENKQYLMKLPNEAQGSNKEIKRRKQFFTNNKTEYKKMNKIPEMDKMYQIVLQNNIPQGINMKFRKSNNSNVQMFVINNPYSNNFSKLKRNFLLNK